MQVAAPTDISTHFAESVIYLLLQTDPRQKADTVWPACKVRGFVQEKLTIQEGFSTLTLEQGNFIMFMPIWYYAKLTLHPF